MTGSLRGGGGGLLVEHSGCINIIYTKQPRICGDQLCLLQLSVGNLEQAGQG